MEKFVVGEEVRFNDSHRDLLVATLKRKGLADEVLNGTHKIIEVKAVKDTCDCHVYPHTIFCTFALKFQYTNHHQLVVTTADPQGGYWSGAWFTH